MRKIFTLLLFITGFFYAGAQTDSLRTDAAKRTETVFKRKFNLRVYYKQPYGTGNNVLAEANRGQLGLGMKLNFFSLYNIHFGNEYEYLQYRVTNPSKAGTASFSKMNTLYLELLYELPLGKVLTVSPKAAVGYTTFRETGRELYGWQYGTTYRLGIYIDVLAAPHFSFFVTGNYSNTSLGINTSGRYEKFFGKLQQFTAGAGLKFTFIE